MPSAAANRRTDILAEYGRAILDGDDAKALSLKGHPAIGTGLLGTGVRHFEADVGQVQSFRKALNRLSTLDVESGRWATEKIESESAEIQRQIDELTAKLSANVEARRQHEDTINAERLIRNRLSAGCNNEVIRATFPDEVAKFRAGEL
ncbi:MAG: hypothetical protein AAFX76_07540 [Planctomycetota bacterium]